jgi:hypothetical protein
VLADDFGQRPAGIDHLLRRARIAVVARGDHDRRGRAFEQCLDLRRRELAIAFEQQRHDAADHGAR